MNKFSKTTKILSSIIIVLVISLAYFAYITYAQEDNYVKDSDYDGLSDQAEINIYHTNPLKADTDGDGYLDSAEVLAGTNPLDPNDPGTSTVAQQPQSAPLISTSTMSSLPWYIARSAGIASFILMFLIVILGIGMTTGSIYSYINPVKSWLIHKYLALALGLVLLVHITALLFDKFVHLGIKDVLIPFYSSFSPIFLTLGIFGFYILLAVIFTSIWFRLKYKKTWRSVHYFVYALFIFSLIHGLFIGTDSNTIFMKVIYISTGSIFVLLLIYRFGRGLLTKKEQ